MFKKIEAIIKEEHLHPVKEALEKAGYMEMTVFPVKGRGTKGGVSLEWRAGPYKVDFLNKVLLMIVVHERNAHDVVHIISRVCKSDPAGGAGKIFVSTVDEIIRIRTGEKNEFALRRTPYPQENPRQ